MTTSITAGYIAASPVPIWHTRIMYDQIARRAGAAVSASGTASGAVLEAPVNDQTFEWWEASALPGHWVVDAGAAVECDCVCVAAHDIGTQGATAFVQHSSDGIAWTTISAAVAPSDDKPIMFLFAPTTARYWRLRITGTTPPKICVIYIGKALAMPQPVNWLGHSPALFNANITKRPSTSDRGQRLGTTIIRGGLEASYEVDHLNELWARNTFQTFTQAAWRYGYFVSWRPEDFPDEVLFGWTEQPITLDNSLGGTRPRDGATVSDGRKMSCSWSLQAHGGYESGIVPWGAT
jgi:hypothetical protein